MKKAISLMVIALISIFLYSCDKVNEDEPINTAYRVFNGSDELLMETNDIWVGIIKARDNSKSSNKCYVLDKDDQVVYKYSTSSYYMYLSDTYHGVTKSLDEATRWAKNHYNSYVLNGTATEFSYVGKEMITDDPTLNKDYVRGVENFSSSYVYLFSEKYNSEVTGGVGYSYVEFKLEFSKAKLKYFNSTDNEYGWNAYVFVNIMCDSPYSNCDMGIIQGWESNKGVWQPVFNYNGKIFTPGNEVITEMVYDEASNTWSGADDLYFKCYVEKNMYVLNITNLTTNVEYHYTCVNDQLTNNAYKSYVLLAASNCPVSKSGGFWNPRSGACFENVIFKDVLVAQYQSDFNYDDAPKYRYQPNSESCSYTLIMGSDNADLRYGNDTSGYYIIMNMYNEVRD